MTNIRRAEIGMDEDGNVYVANPSGTKWKALGGDGGESLPFARNVGQAEFDFAEDVVNNDGFKKFALTLSDGDETIVDLTNPNYPLIITPGLYAFTLKCQRTSGSNNGAVGLLVDDNYYSISALSTQPPNDLGQFANCVVWWCDASDPFAVLGVVDPGDTTHFAGSLYLQRIK